MKKSYILEYHKNLMQIDPVAARELIRLNDSHIAELYEKLEKNTKKKRKKNKIKK